jgi:hypothetical protein
MYPHQCLFLDCWIPPWVLQPFIPIISTNIFSDIEINASFPSMSACSVQFDLEAQKNGAPGSQFRKFKKSVDHTMRNALDAAVRFIPTPPAFSDISNT